MKKILFFIHLFVGANCSCLSLKDKKEIFESYKNSQLNKNVLKGLQTSVNQVNASVAQNKKYIYDLHNQSSSNSMKFESILYELQKNLTKRTEQIIDQKFASISEDHKNSSLNINKLHDSVVQLSAKHNKTSFTVDQLSASVAENKKYMKDLYNQSSFYSEMFEINLGKMQKNIMESTEQLIDQKFASISKDLQKAALNTDKFQTSIDQVSAYVTKNMKYINHLHNQSSSNSMMFMMFESKLDEILNNLENREKIIDQKIASISEDHKNSALNTKKLQDSVDQLSASVAENKKYIKEEHTETSSTLKVLENKLSDSQVTVKTLKDHQNAIQNMSDCKDVFNSGKKVSTSYLLPKYNREVLCDMTTDGGGWLVIQKRQKATQQVDFNRNWASYKEGFGDLDTEFWIGNEFLHRITNQKSYELRIHMEDFEKGHFYATYSEFRVGNEESGYQLHVGGFEGYVTDSLEYSNNMKFTTLDRANDEWHGVNCAEKYAGGFWYYYGCAFASMNGLFPTVPDSKNFKLIRWELNVGRLILINIEMKIRPKQ